MNPATFKENQQFIGRQREIRLLHEIAERQTPAIVITYGRRRIGKTELLEQSYRKRNILKFEGIEGLDQSSQRQRVMQQLAIYTEQPLLRDVRVDNWTDVFRHIYDYIKEGMWTLYFEEVQWLACYEQDFVSELKFVWDNYFRHNAQLIVILCGSAPSFMINEVAHSKSLYNRSQHEIALRELNLIETKQLLSGQSDREVMDAYLTVGGIPEYLLRLRDRTSIFTSLCRNAFEAEAFFSTEYKRIFISSMASNENYKKIIEYLSKQRFATRDEILTHLKIASGGRFSELLQDLITCGFIEKYTPFNLSEESIVARYAISDNYLQFYFKFIKPIAKQIEQGAFNNNPVKAIKIDSYYQWLGYAFERFCRKYDRVIANILGFSAVHYQAGPYFSRSINHQTPGYQIDLAFDRDDNVLTICELRYQKDRVNKKIVNEFERKLALLDNPKQKTIHRVLIAFNGVDESVAQQGYFDNIITLDDLFNVHYW